MLYHRTIIAQSNYRELGRTVQLYHGIIPRM